VSPERTVAGVNGHKQLRANYDLMATASQGSPVEVKLGPKSYCWLCMQGLHASAWVTLLLLFGDVNRSCVQRLAASDIICNLDVVTKDTPKEDPRVW
jgi:hypothetical protein